MRPKAVAAFPKQFTVYSSVYAEVPPLCGRLRHNRLLTEVPEPFGLQFWSGREGRAGARHFHLLGIG